MNIPSLPTDNLYKFMAIFGLVLFSFSFYLNSRYLDERHEINNDLSEYLIEVNRDTFELNQASRRFDSIEKTIVYFEDSNLYDSISELLPYHDQQLKKLIEFLEKNKETRVIGKKLLARLEYNEKKQMVDQKQSGVLLIIGTILIVVGFFLWYLKHQRYIDAEREWEGKKFIKLLKEDEQENESVIDTVVANSESQEDILD